MSLPVRFALLDGDFQPVTTHPLAAKEWVGLTKGGLWLALILVMLAVVLKFAKEYRRSGGQFMGIFAGNTADDSQDAHATLTKFRELHARGGLSDEEYRTIKTKLASELQSDAKPQQKGSSTEAPVFNPVAPEAATADPSAEEDQQPKKQ